jgi:hypothetical protein
MWVAHNVKGGTGCQRWNWLQDDARQPMSIPILMAVNTYMTTSHWLVENAKVQAGANCLL